MDINKVIFDIASIAVKAMLYEVTCFPSPGLVSPVSSGAHRDMDFFTFVDSVTAVSRYFINFSEKGFSKADPKEIFRDIRSIGIQCEVAMFKATKGINTHKGMIFLMGICCAAAAKVIYEEKNFSEIRSIIKAMTKGLVEEELSTLRQAKTYGEKLYLTYGLTGIRGQVEAGLPIVFEYSLELYKVSRGLGNNAALIKTLLGIMQYCEDSNIIHRHSIKVMEEVQIRAKNIFNKAEAPNFNLELEKLNEEFIEKNISPGGSADLLGVTVFLAEIEEMLAGINGSMVIDS